MNKEELIKRISKKTNYTLVQCESLLDATLEIIQNTVARGEDVKLVGFGTFSSLDKKPRQGRNPKTGEVVPIPRMKVPRFKPGKDFKNQLT